MNKHKKELINKKEYKRPSLIFNESFTTMCMKWKISSKRNRNDVTNQKLWGCMNECFLMIDLYLHIRVLGL